MPRRSLPQLGELERLVLARLWSHGPAGVREMHAALGEARGITANTIGSTLERLRRKQLAEREKRGRAYRYRATISRREWAGRALEGLLGALPGNDPELLLASFVDLTERTGRDHLAELERLVRMRRAARGKDPR